MPLVLIAGISGSGKSAVAVELRRRGYEAHDLDLDGNCVWVNRETEEVVPAGASRSAESLEWFAKHDWCLVPEKISAMAERADSRTVFLCGMTKNEHEVSHLIWRVIYLSIDAQTMQRRVASRTSNDFGQAEHEMAAILEWLEFAERDHRRAGAVIVDATRPLAEVVDGVLRATWTDVHDQQEEEEATMTEVMSRDTQDVIEGPEAFFTGRVTVRGQFARDEPSRVTGAIVTFEPGARTAWHSHPLGQTLIVIDGVGWTQVEDDPIQQFAAGDILLCPRNRPHWHGATPESSMTHVAIQEALDGTNVTWLEKVTDEQYLAGPPQ